MAEHCMCCGKEIVIGLLGSISCSKCISSGYSGCGFYTVDGSPRWCNVKNEPSCQISFDAIITNEKWEVEVENDSDGACRYQILRGDITYTCCGYEEIAAHTFMGDGDGDKCPKCKKAVTFTRKTRLTSRAADLRHTCGDCGKELQIVRPGKYQCDCGARR